MRFTCRNLQIRQADRVQGPRFGDRRIIHGLDKSPPEIRFVGIRRAGLFSCLFLSLLVRPIPADDSDLRVTQHDNLLAVSDGGRQILEYQYQPSPTKPYVRKLFSPSGVQVLRDSPADHKHHHALMFGLGADSVDFWAEGEGSGVQKSRTISFSKSGFMQDLEWTDVRSSKSLLTEQRSIIVHADPGVRATLLTWRSRLGVPADKDSTVLGGSHYFGLGMRFVESMDENGHFVNSESGEGESIRGTERLTEAKWCAYVASADGHRVTVAILDFPGNPRHPARMFTMTAPFAYLAATLNLWKEPVIVRVGDSLELTYGIALWDGEVEPATIGQLYRHWLLAVSGL